jgi:hypothetical protein
VNGTAHGLAFVAAEIVDDDDVAAPQGGHQHLLNIGQEACAIDRTVEHAGRIDAVHAQRGNESQGAPASVRGPADETLAPTAPATQRRHVCFDPGLVDEHQPAGINLPPISSPVGAATGDVGPLTAAFRLF